MSAQRLHLIVDVDYRAEHRGEPGEMKVMIWEAEVGTTNRKLVGSCVLDATVGYTLAAEAGSRAVYRRLVEIFGDLARPRP
jgi:hypothetical protein